LLFACAVAAKFLCRMERIVKYSVCECTLRCRCMYILDAVGRAAGVDHSAQAGDQRWWLRTSMRSWAAAGQTAASGTRVRARVRVGSAKRPWARKKARPAAAAPAEGATSRRGGGAR